MALPVLVTKPIAWLARTILVTLLPLAFALTLGVSMAVRECERLRTLEAEGKTKGKSEEVKARERSC